MNVSKLTLRALRRLTTSKAKNPVARAAGLVVEQLEERRLMSVVTINGTGGNDTIVYNVNSFTLNGITTFINTATATDIQINGLGGSDTISVNKAFSAAPVTVTAGTGADTVNVGGGKASLDIDFGALTVHGGGDVGDNITFDDRLNTGSANFSKDEGSLSGTSIDGINVYTVNLGNGDDAFTFSFLDVGEVLTVKGNAGNEFFDIGGGFIDDNIRGLIHLDGGTNTAGGGDQVDLNAGNGGNGNFAFKSNGFFGTSGSKLVDYVGCEDLKLNCGEFADTVNASTSSQRVNLQLGSGDDNATGSPFADNIEGGFDNDTIRGGGGDDALGDGGESGDDGDDTYFGEGGNDTINGVAGNDTLDGGEGNDKLIGGTEDDNYVFANAIVAQTDTIIENAGDSADDRLDFGACTVAVTVNLTSSTVATQANRTLKTAVAGSLTDIENIITGSGTDTITGNNADNDILANAGVDTVFGRGGADFINGGAGNNKIFGEDGNDHIFGGPNDDIIDGGNNNDSIEGREGNDTILGGPGNDDLFAGSGNNIIDGGEGNDDMFGSEGGNDTYRFAQASVSQVDFISEVAVGETDTLDFSAVSSAVKVNLLSDTLATHAFRTVKTNGLGSFVFMENVIGGSGADTLAGNNTANVLTGNGGADIITGGAGNDILIGGEGSDTLSGGADNDTYKFAAAAAVQTDKIAELAGQGNDTLDFGALTTSVTVNLLSNTLATHLNRTVVTSVAGQFANFENVTTGSGMDKIFGNNAINILRGGGNNDEITGGGAADQLFGDDGVDKFFALDGIKDTINGGLGADILGSADGIDVKVSVP